MRPTEQKMGLYVYCLVKHPPARSDFGTLGFDSGGVYALEYRDFAPIVSAAPIKEYEVNDDEVGVHQRVVQEVMRDHDVIPVAYGMAFKNKKVIQVAMNAGYSAIKKALPIVEGKVELGIKVFKPKGVDLNGDEERCRSEIFSRLKGEASNSKLLKLFSDRLVLNAAFLVERSRMDDFSCAVDETSETHSHLKVQYSGPWAAYNFVDIHILGKRKGGFR